MGYRIDIDHGGLHHVRHLHGRVPGRGPRHEPARGAGRRDRPGPGRPLRVDDGAPAPGRRVHRLRHLRPRVPAQRDDAGRDDRRGAARGAPGPDRPPAPSAGRRLDPAVARDPRGPQARPRLAVGRPVHAGGRGRDRKPWQVWTSMVDDAPPSPLAPCQAACPAGTDAGRYVGLIGAGPLRRGLRRRGRGQSRSRRSAAGSARRRARPPAVAACWTSRSRSGRSSDSPPSTARSRRSTPPAVRRPERVGDRRWRARPACPRPTTSPASAIPSPSSRRCRCPAA